MTSLVWKELSAQDFAELDKDATLVILPIGSIEQHGPHLPVGTDTYGIEAVIRGISEKDLDVDLVILPPIWCSKSNEHIRFPGTIFLTRETFARVVHEISESIARSGFKKMIVMNWHGGNIDLLAVLARDIRLQNGLLTFIVDCGKLLFSYKPKPDWIDEQSYNIHAGRFETSIMLAKHPHLVKEITSDGLGSDFAHGKIAASFKGFEHLVPEGGPIIMGWTTDDLTEDGVIGDPVGANAEDGEKYLKNLIDQICMILPEIAKFTFQG